MHLANEISQVLIAAVCDNRGACECGGEVFGGLEDGPVFVYDLLDGGVVFVVGGGERDPVAGALILSMRRSDPEVRAALS